jgi:hypothetical protein
LLFSFVGVDQFAQGLCWLMFPRWIGVFHVMCSAHLFVLSNDMQAGFELAALVVVVVEAATAVRNGSKFSQYNVMCGGFP